MQDIWEFWIMAEAVQPIGRGENLEDQANCSLDDFACSHSVSDNKLCTKK